MGNAKMKPHSQSHLQKALAIEIIGSLPSALIYHGNLKNKTVTCIYKN